VQGEVVASVAHCAGEDMDEWGSYRRDPGAHRDVELVSDDRPVGELDEIKNRWDAAGLKFFHRCGLPELRRARSMANATCVYGFSVESVPSLSKTATRSSSGTNASESGSVTSLTNSTIEVFAVVSRQLGSGSRITSPRGSGG
jgi:hypothetical protein